jgi:hypothetical protein
MSSFEIQSSYSSLNENICSESEWSGSESWYGPVLHCPACNYLLQASLLASVLTNCWYRRKSPEAELRGCLVAATQHPYGTCWQFLDLTDHFLCYQNRGRWLIGRKFGVRLLRNCNNEFP